MSATSSSSVSLSPTNDTLPSPLSTRKYNQTNTYRWADGLDLPGDEILLRIRYEN